MHFIRYMTDKEIEENPGVFGFKEYETGDLVLLKNSPDDVKARVIRHEIGHIKYPNDWSPDDSVKKQWEDYLLSELLASYFSLKMVPNDLEAKKYIRHQKLLAKFKNIDEEKIEELDALAKQEVGYEE